MKVRKEIAALLCAAMIISGCSAENSVSSEEEEYIEQEELLLASYVRITEIGESSFTYETGKLSENNDFSADGAVVTADLSDNVEYKIEFAQGECGGTLRDFSVGNVIKLTATESGEARGLTLLPDSVSEDNTAVIIVNGDYSILDENFDSSEDGQTAVRIEGGSSDFTYLAVDKTGIGDSEMSEGNAGFSVLNGASVILDSSDVTAGDDNSIAVLCKGNGSFVKSSDINVVTDGSDSCCVKVSDGASFDSYNIYSEVNGTGSAGLLAESGSTVILDSGEFITYEEDSVAAYVLSAVKGDNTTFASALGTSVHIGENGRLELTDSYIYSGEDESGSCVYLDGISELEVKGGGIEASEGSLFALENANSIISLEDAVLSLGNGVLLDIREGSKASLTAANQTFEGDIYVAEGSSLILDIGNACDYTGAVNPDGTGTAADVTLESGSVWSLTADSYLSSFTGNTEDIITDDYHVYVNGELLI